MVVWERCWDDVVVVAVVVVVVWSVTSIDCERRLE